MHRLEVKAVDILNAYVIAPVNKKLWTILVPEIFKNAGKIDVIVWVLYELKIAGATFRIHLAQCITIMR